MHTFRFVQWITQTHVCSSFSLAVCLSSPIIICVCWLCSRVQKMENMYFRLGFRISENSNFRNEKFCIDVRLKLFISNLMTFCFYFLRLNVLYLRVELLMEIIPLSYLNRVDSSLKPVLVLFFLKKLDHVRYVFFSLNIFMS